MNKLILALALAGCCFGGSATAQRSAKAKQTPIAEGTAVVAVSNLKFEPRTLTVKVGTTVKWENKEGAHTVIASRNGLFESETLSAGQSFTHKFTKPGKYPYYCSFHGDAQGHDMAGTVVVVR